MECELFKAQAAHTSQAQLGDDFLSVFVDQEKYRMYWQIDSLVTQ